MEFKAILFDLDGVICSTDEYHYRAWKALADKLDTPFDRVINNRLRGVSRMASLEIVLEKYTGPALTEEDKLALATEKNEIYRESLKEMSTADLSDEVKETFVGMEPKDCLVVEDAVSGAEAGHNAGMKVACVGDAAKNGAGDWNLTSFRELEDVADGKNA